ncbi:MAG TPA: EpsI family protein [Streptosporangiaceae bacterium]|nr:EpsI family protein [Streptosporangiaceae bacterium]
MAGTTRVVWIAVLMLAGANGLVLWGAGTRESALRGKLAGLPAGLQGWVEGSVFEEGKVRNFGGDDVLSRGYERPSGERLWLYVGYWRRQREGQPIAFTPRLVLPEAEWKVVFSQVAWIGGGEGGPRIPVRQVVFERFNKRQAVTYWYVQGGGRVVTDWSVGRLAMIWDALRWGRSDVALVRLASPIRRGEAGAALEGQRRFAERIAPALAERLPG